MGMAKSAKLKSTVERGRPRQRAEQQRSVETDRRQQIQVECPMPLFIIEHGEATTRGCRTADDMDDDVGAAEADTVRRRVIEERYKRQIDELYAQAEATTVS